MDFNQRGHYGGLNAERNGGLVLSPGGERIAFELADVAPITKVAVCALLASQGHYDPVATTTASTFAIGPVTSRSILTRSPCPNLNHRGSSYGRLPHQPYHVHPRKPPGLPPHCLGLSVLAVCCPSAPCRSIQSKGRKSSRLFLRVSAAQSITIRSIRSGCLSSTATSASLTGTTARAPPNLASARFAPPTRN